MAAGDFALAEKKLLKALDRRPDDGELWWSLMLCKCGIKSDGELESAVKQKYESAEGNNPPPTPFDTSYCKNALKYSVSPKRKEFVERVSAELSEIWQAKGGKALKAPRTNVKTFTRRDCLGVTVSAATAVAAVGGALGAYAVFEHATWALWTGFALLILFSFAAFFLRGAYVKHGGAHKIVDIALVAVFAATGAALLAAGVYIGSRSVIMLAAAILVMAALVAGYRFIGGGKRKDESGKRSARGKSDASNKRAAYDRANVIAAPKDKSKKSAEKGRGNVYKDEDD